MRYVWLDGLRGLTALYVVLHHAVAEVPAANLPWWMTQYTRWFAYGREGVAVFIVLSGYCLMLPVARDPEGKLRGGVLAYLRRRARRILPPYYATLVLAALMIALIPALRFHGNPRWEIALPGSWRRAFIAHVFLVHNFSFDYLLKFDPSMWSIAPEWQIYFLFPLLLVVWRRFGIVTTVMAAFGATALFASAVSPVCAAISAPWFLGLFAFGMAAACHGLAPRGSHRRKSIFFAITLPFVLLFIPQCTADVVIGAATATLLVYCAKYDGRAGEKPLALRILASRPAETLGKFSYSLYLIHYPLMSLSNNTMMLRKVGDSTRLLVLVFVATPLIVGVSFLFYLVFERPFLAKPVSVQPSLFRGPVKWRSGAQSASIASAKSQRRDPSPG